MKMTKERALRKAGQRTLWADSAKIKGLAMREELKSDARYNDSQFWHEPIKLGHHSENRQRRLREAYYRKDKIIMELEEKAKLHREKAENLTRFANTHKGDAERKREAKRKIADASIVQGSRVYDSCYREGTVLKINKKTYTVRFASGLVTTRDKSYFVR